MSDQDNGSVADTHGKYLAEYCATLGIKGQLCGVYMIESPIGAKYIGASRRISKRWREHRVMKSPQQKKLYESFATFGLDQHTFTIVELCSRETLAEREAYHGMLHDVINSGLNSCLGKNSLGYPTRSIEALSKMKSHQRGNTLTDEKKAELRAQRLGVQRPKEVGEKIGRAHTGMKRSQEARERMSQAAKLRTTPTAFTKLSKVVLCTCSGIFYNSIAQAATAHGFNRDYLGEMLRGRKRNKTNLMLV